ncbi:heterokaryon incompatibility protein-domain-containing protein [Cadophora sp. MPI-SDFR-AT-0126]|nr:heterokaryon incompatibility protein-domain-containing protein [Leotiomycetes sp. MPI-SDFR-AT-0126]
MATSNDQPVSKAPAIGPLKRVQTLDTGAAAARNQLRHLAEKVIEEKIGTYEFQPLDYENDIRILRIFHGKPHEKLKCMLFPSALNPPDGQNSSSRSTSGISKYWALSYWWGLPDEKPSNKIHIYYDNGGREGVQELSVFNRYGTFYIRDNLKSALVRFRHETDDKNVWVDAICINQEDKKEKNAQVARMHEVYMQATMVCIWLGDGTEQTPETFEFLQSILNLGKLDALVQTGEPSAAKCALVVQLMTNRWFSRRWILQELALSKQATVRWGDEELYWSDFADAIALFMTKYDDIKRKNLISGQYRDTDARALGAYTIVHATINLFRKSHDGRVEQRLIPLEILVSSMLLAFEASEPRDTIFAVLTLAKDSQITSAEPDAKEDFRISPDYDKCLLDVYTDFMDYCMEKSRSLDIICRYWAPCPKPLSREGVPKENSTASVPETMPSWIPRIEKSAFGEPHGVVAGRANGDSFVGGPERRGQQTYNASLNLPAWHEFGTYDTSPPRTKMFKKSKTFPYNKAGPSHSTGSLGPVIQGIPIPATAATAGSANQEPKLPYPKSPKYDGTLLLRGFCLDVVERVSDRVAGGRMIPDNALDMGGWDHKWKVNNTSDKIQPVPEKLWRTLVADRGPNGTSAPGWYRRACFECLQHTDRSGDLDIDRLKTSPETSSTQITFLERVEPIVWGRRFFETRARQRSQKPLFGLGSNEVRVGDMVCILFGCSVPVLLRQMMQHKAPEYLFIGECYVHGMMDGEAVTSRFGSKHPQHPYKKATTFRLV